MKSLSKSILYIVGVVVVTAAVFSIPSFVLEEKSILTRAFENVVAPMPTRTETLPFTNSRHLAYNIEKIRVDENGARLLRRNDRAEVFTLVDIPVPQQGEVIGFSDDAATPPGTSIAYQLSPDAAHWYYFDGNNWSPATKDCMECFSSAGDISEHINELSVSAHSLKVKAVLASATFGEPVIRSISVETRGRLPEMKPEQVRILQDLRVNFAKAAPKKAHLVYVCHVPSDDPENAATIEIDESAVEAHLADNPGDSLGECPEPPKPPSEGKVYVCHAPAGNAENSRTIEIDESAVEAHLADNPGDSLGECPPPSAPPEWDKSSLEVSAECEAPIAVFTVTNIGEPLIGDMQGPSEYRVYRRGELEDSGTIELEGGASQQIAVAAYGDKVDLEVDQRPGHPGQEMVEASVSKCGEQPTGNKPPVANDDTVTTTVNTPIEIHVLANDYDEDGNLVPASLEVISRPKHGSATVDSTAGTITYTPETDYSGSDKFLYRVCDSGAPQKCNPAHVNVLVSAAPPPNQPPVAVDDEAVTSRETSVDIFVLANDSDPDGWLVIDSLSVITLPAHGMTSVNVSTGVVTYLPEGGFEGTDTFEYWICDSGSPQECTTATVTVRVIAGPVNEPPLVEDDAATTFKEASVVIDALANDSDTEGELDPDSLVIINQPDNGTAAVTDDRQIEYSPDAGFVGIDTFKYRVCDSGGLCGEAIVTVEVKAPVDVPPLAVDDQAVTLVNTAITIDVLANDSDADGVLDPTTVSVVSGPEHGSAVANAVSGRIAYTPDPSYLGSDSFQYQVCDDDGLCSTAAVQVNVVQPPPSPKPPPVANADGAQTQVNTKVSINVLANDYDPDGRLVPATLSMISSSSGVIINIDPAAGLIDYTPAPDFVGTDSFEYQICDNDGQCDTARVTVTVSAGELNAPPVVNDDSVTTEAGKPVNIDVLANDSDPDGTLDPATVSIVTSTPGTGVTAVVTGQVTYVPAPGFTGSDSFTYEVCDDGGDCGSATVTVNVLGSRTAPVANDDAAESEINKAVTIDVLANDFDLDGYLVPALLAVVAAPSNGTASPAAEAGKLIYTPKPGFIGSDSFAYEVCDNDSLCDSASVSVTVTLPVAPPTPPAAPPAAPPPPPAPPIIPPVILAPPVPSEAISPTISLDCNVPVYYAPNVRFTGFVSIVLSEGDRIEYSVTNGNSWNLVESTSTVAGGTAFGFMLRGLEGGGHSVRARLVPADTEAVNPASSSVCRFLIDTGLVFGANQFVLKTTPAPMTASGTVQAIVGEPLTVYLEAKGASQALVRVIDTGEEFPLTYDGWLKLWRGEIVISAAGFYRLEAEIANNTRTYSREINGIMATEQAGIYDANTAQPLSGVTVTVMRRNAESGVFEVWNGQAYGQQNPLTVNGAFSLTLPEGEYYLRLERDGYNTISSLITVIDQPSVVTALVRMDSIQGWANRIRSLVTPAGTANNFPLRVSTPPATELLPTGQPAPNFNMTTMGGLPSSLYAQMSRDPRPTLIFVYSTWNTDAQVQIDVYRRIVKRLGDKYRFLPVSTMEPSSVKAAQNSRGDYGLDFFQPSDDFYQKYYVTSLPMFIALDQNKNVVGTLNGRRSESELADWITRVFGQ